MQLNSRMTTLNLVYLSTKITNIQWNWTWKMAILNGIRLTKKSQTRYLSATHLLTKERIVKKYIITRESESIAYKHNERQYLVIFFCRIHGTLVYSLDIGNAYLKDKTKEKGFIIARYMDLKKVILQLLIRSYIVLTHLALDGMKKQQIL